MKPFVIILIRLLAIYFVTRNIMWSVPTIFNPSSWASNASEMLLSITFFLIGPAIVGIVLWLLAPAIATRALSEETAVVSLHEEGVVSAGSFLIGVYWAISSIQTFVSQISSTGYVNYGAIVVFAISLFLIIGSKVVVRVYKWLQQYGTQV